jgi:hypothetical protein
MSVRGFIALTGAGLLIGVLAWSLTQVDNSPTAGSPGTPHTSPGAEGIHLEAVPPVPGASNFPSRRASKTAEHTTPRANVAPGGAQFGTEILPSPSSAASAHEGLPGLRPSRSTTMPLATSPLPKPATRTGRIVAGFPRSLAPPPGHTVVTTSVASSDGVLQASLIGTCQRPCAVLRVFRTRLAALGFTDVATRSTENQPTASLRRGTDNVIVSVTQKRGNTVSYTLYAVLSPGPRT